MAWGHEDPEACSEVLVRWDLLSMRVVIYPQPKSDLHDSVRFAKMEVLVVTESSSLVTAGRASAY